jgi:hypothetical protein
MSDASDPPPPPEESDVEIHKPKPIRNWREFLTEIGVIVLSVCIALGAEQVVEWIHWRNQVTTARSAIARELMRVMEAGLERVRETQCVEQRLDAMATILDQASRTGSLPPVPQIGQPHARVWPDDVWRTVVASQTAPHFPQEELTRLSRVYSQEVDLSVDNREELLAWANLSAMVGPGRRLDPASEAELRKALSQARYYNRIMTLGGGQIARGIGRMDLPFPPDLKSAIDHYMRAPISSAPMCRPMEAGAPPLYGQAPLSNFLNAFRDWKKYPPYVQKVE